MEKRKLRRGTRDKEEKGREGERCPQDLSSSFTLRHCPPRGSLFGKIVARLLLRVSGIRIFPSSAAFCSPSP